MQIVIYLENFILLSFCDCSCPANGEWPTTLAMINTNGGDGMVAMGTWCHGGTLWEILLDHKLGYHR